jgi:adenine phosphoribosyltransferase
MISQFEGSEIEALKSKVREIPDFPKPGILFYDLTTLFKDPAGLRQVIDIFTERYRNAGIDKVVGIESRGFILGPPLAYNLGAGFVPVRKPGKLPAPTLRASYDLEYGKDTLEIHRDAVLPGERVLIIDDLIATGGTAAAVVGMVREMAADLAGLAFLVELDFLKGRDRLVDLEIFSVLRY